MARRRMISENILYDPQFNSVGIEAQCLFVRMLTKTDDYGIIPAEPYSLISMLNLPEVLKKHLEKYIGELEGAGLILLVAMIGAIVLTLRHRAGVKRQKAWTQISREPADSMAMVDAKPGEGVE